MNTVNKLHLFVAIVAIINLLLFITTVISTTVFLVVLGICFLYTWKYKK